MTSSTGLLAGLSEIAPRYDALFCDVWGVVHNGLAAYPRAVEALVAYRKAGGRVVFITNAPRPSAPIVAMLDGFGVPRAAYDGIVSSGDASRAMIAAYRGRTVHHVGPPKVDDALFEGLGVTRGPAEAAEVVVVTDLVDDDDTPDMYDGQLSLWLERSLPMICANPDKFVEIGEKLVYCAGALADIYAERGGKVEMAGKPFPPIYAECLRLAEDAAGHPIGRSRILAIGDSVRTDAVGAANFDIDLLFITGSIHAGEIDAFGTPDPGAVRALVAPSGARLTGFLSRLAW